MSGLTASKYDALDMSSRAELGDALEGIAFSCLEQRQALLQAYGCVP